MILKVVIPGEIKGGNRSLEVMLPAIILEQLVDIVILTKGDAKESDFDLHPREAAYGGMSHKDLKASWGALNFFCMRRYVQRTLWAGVKLTWQQC